MLESLLGVDPDRTLRVFALVLARTLPLAFIAPWLGWRGTSLVVRIAVTVTVATSLVPLALSVAPDLPPSWLALILAGLREAMVGATFAIAVSAPLYAMGWTGALIDRWRGSPPDGSVGPAEDGSVLGTLHLSAAVVLFVLLGGHRLALAAFAEGLIDLPPGLPLEASHATTLGLGAAQIVSHALQLTLAFAAPAAIAFVLLELGVGLFHRVAPALQGWMDAMPLRAALGIAIALVSISALLPRLGPIFARSIESASDLIGRF